MRTYLTLCLSLIMVAPAAHAQDYPQPVTNLIEAARSDCSSLENGVLSIDTGAVQSVDLTGNKIGDWMVDYSHLTCSSAASMYCGTGGCSLSLVVGDTVTERLAKGWRTVDMDPLKVVLLQVHGANCGGTNLNACVEALVWDHEAHRFFTTLDVSE